MEPFDLPVGLGPVGQGEARFDVERGAGLAPGVGTVGRSVVGQDSLHGDTVFGEPGHRAVLDTYCGVGFLVGTDFGVRDTGVVIDHGVNVPGLLLGAC